MSDTTCVEVQQRLDCNGREKLRRQSILDDHHLYLGFRQEHLDESGDFKPELFRLPDLSCNWSQFSEPADVRYRTNGNPTDGCLAMPVCEVHHDNVVITVHDPLCNQVPENYSHCEIRVNPGELNQDEDPPKKCKTGGKATRKAWRKHVILNSSVSIEAEA